MIEVIQLSGTDKKLYDKVAPLVMNPTVIQYNQNYPFKTNEKFIWFIALLDDEVAGFIPVEPRKNQWVINNYYVAPSNKESLVFSALLQAVSQSNKTHLTAIVQTIHQAYFTTHGFTTVKEWKKYLKMEKKKKEDNKNGTAKKCI